ncbi:hypothetical protein BUALT_Bualt01G0119400 [Buddleja alternifolia]|uniref:Hsp70-interacting protein N-terminal domain-containing protein n=1 Tax=Buddleja alternifolia TaxID=168488 RepID=A0AAV6YDE5_9LAMI|nr:hypothetical protein BUALT_Bualt01G0119400 [Buddleja alternifolia]
MPGLKIMCSRSFFRFGAPISKLRSSSIMAAVNAPITMKEALMLTSIGINPQFVHGKQWCRAESKMEAKKIEELKGFVEQSKLNPSLLHTPSFAFFKNYLQSLDAQIPPSVKSVDAILVGLLARTFEYLF